MNPPSAEKNADVRRTELESRLAALARSSRDTRSPRAYFKIEEQALALLRPLRESLLRKTGGRRFSNDLHRSHFDLFALECWRKRVAADAEFKVIFDPNGFWVEKVVSFLNTHDVRDFQAERGTCRRLRRELLARLKSLYVDPAGVSLKDLSPDLLRCVAAHPGLTRGWKDLLRDFKDASSEEFDAARGGFVGWVAARFCLRAKDLIGREEHAVARTQKTECARRRADSVGADMAGCDAWGYVRLSAGEGGGEPRDVSSETDQRRLEARLELEQVLGKILPKDRTFLEPLLDRRAEDLKDLARHWDVSPAAVSKRLARIRRGLQTA